MSASPPTERNARTGLFTPPTSTCSARWKISADRALLPFREVCGVLIETLCMAALPFQPFRHVLGMVGQNNVRPGPSNARQDFQHSALFVQPTFLRSRL